jgi:hypothetical protein
VTDKNPALAVTYREPTVGTRSLGAGCSADRCLEDQRPREAKSGGYLLVSPGLPHGGQDYSGEQDYNGHRRSTFLFHQLFGPLGSEEPRRV